MGSTGASRLSSRASKALWPSSRISVSEPLDLSGDLSVVAAMVGHADVRTTARSDRRGKEVKRRAARALDVPYTHRGVCPRLCRPGKEKLPELPTSASALTRIRHSAPALDRQG